MDKNRTTQCHALLSTLNVLHLRVSVNKGCVKMFFLHHSALVVEMMALVLSMQVHMIEGKHMPDERARMMHIIHQPCCSNGKKDKMCISGFK